jgi:hypothetical protein
VAPGGRLFGHFDTISPRTEVDERPRGDTGRVPPGGSAVGGDRNKRAAHAERATSHGLKNLGVRRNCGRKEQEHDAGDSTPTLNVIILTNQIMTIVAGEKSFTPSRPQTSSLLARVSGVLFAPRSTFEALARSPRVVGVVTLTLFVTIGCSAIVLNTDVGQLALLDRWDRTASALGQAVDNELYAGMIEASRHGVVYATVMAIVTGPVLTLGLSVLLFAAFRAPAPGAVRYRQVLAVVGHAGVILALRQVAATPLTYVRETLSSPLTMGAFFPMMDGASPAAQVLAAMDVFVIWWLVVLAVGMSVLYRRPTRRVAYVLVGAYVTLSITGAMLTMVVGGTA